MVEFLKFIYLSYMRIRRGKAYQMRSRLGASESYAQRQEQVRQDIRNGEDLDSLALSVDPDDYYRQHSYDPG